MNVDEVEEVDVETEFFDIWGGRGVTVRDST